MPFWVALVLALAASDGVGIRIAPLSLLRVPACPVVSVLHVKFMQRGNMTSEPETIDILEGMLTREQVSKALGLAVDTLGRWATQRKGPPVTKIGPKVYYRRESLEAWVRAQEVAHEPDRVASRHRRGRR